MMWSLGVGDKSERSRKVESFNRIALEFCLSVFEWRNFFLKGCGKWAWYIYVVELKFLCNPSNLVDAKTFGWTLITTSSMWPVKAPFERSILAWLS